MEPDEWRRQHQGLFFLNADESEALEAHLREIGFLRPSENLVRTEKAGDGNMNCTVRTTTNERSFIVKQSRPWVEKYPQFEAPWDRAVREMEFYEIVQDDPNVAGTMPALLHADNRTRVLILEDLGIGKDYTGTYRGDQFSLEELTGLANYLSALHSSFCAVKDHRGLANREMRQLNSQHIFFIPLQRENGLDLNSISPGLGDVADTLMADQRYVSTVHELAQTYLSDGERLLHGDFFPGSFLKTPNGPRVIDPEFAYFGRSEFDPAVLIAHLLLGRQPPASIECFLNAYRPPETHDDGLMIQLAGVEVMRRLIGYAQLPLGYGTQQRKHLLEMSRQMVLDPDKELLAARHA